MAWEPHQDDAGRVYYYDPVTRQSTWEKPEELLTPLEVALNRTGWIEYATDDGVKYWNNETTGESVWDIPDDVKQLEKKIENERSGEKLNSVPKPSSGTSNITEAAPTTSIPLASTSKFSSESHVHPVRVEFLRSQLAENHDDPMEAAIKEFHSALARAGVDKPKSQTGNIYSMPNFMSWNEAIPTLIKDPGYWVIRDPIDRRKYFDQFITEKIFEYQTNIQNEWDITFTNMLDLLSSSKYARKIKYYSTWRSFKDELNNELPFQQSLDHFPNEVGIKLQKFAFHKRLQDLRKQHNVEIQNTKNQELKILRDQFSKLKVDYNSLWEDVYTSLKESGILNTKVLHLDNIDILNEYEEYIKRIERDENEKLRQSKKTRYRYERKCREGFVQLLQQLKENRQLKVNSKWSEEVDSTTPAIYPLIKDDPRYINICGNPGSTPLELFWDSIEDEKRKIKLNRELVIDILSSKQTRYPSSFEKFCELVKLDPRGEQIPNELLNEVYKSLKHHDDEIKKYRHESRDSRDTHHRDEEDRFSSSRQFKRLANDFYDALHHLEPPILPDDTWTTVKPRISTFPEYNALDEPNRREIFDKFMRRLQRSSRTHSPHPPYRRDRDSERRQRDLERVSRNEDLRNRPAGRGLDHGPALDY